MKTASNIHHPKAFSLVEVLLVLAVLASIIAGALHIMRLIKFQSEVAQLRQSVDNTFILMNEFYFATTLDPQKQQSNCRMQVEADGVTPGPLLTANLNQLINAYSTFSSLTPAQIGMMTNMPAGIGLQIQYNKGAAIPNTTNPILYTINFQVVMTFTGYSNTQIQTIRGQLNGDAQPSSSQIVWTRFPGNSIVNSLDNSLWVASTAHQIELNLYKNPGAGGSSPTSPNYCPI